MKRILSLVFVLILMMGCRSEVKTPRKPPNVTVAAIDQRDVPIYVDAIGQAISPVTVQIKPQVAGKLLETFIQQGDIVQEGQVIYRMDPRPYQAILDEAKAQYEHDYPVWLYAQRTVERYKPVVAGDFISILTFEQYESNAESARAQLELDKAAILAAQINVDYCDIVAPVTGKISFFNVDVGNILAIDDPNVITTIRPSSYIDIEFSLPQQQFEMIRRVQGNEGKWKFQAILPETPDMIHHGTTFFIDNQINQDTGTILLKGRLPNQDSIFWPGEFIKVRVLHRIAPQAFVVPPGAILMGRNGPYLYTIN
jgi:multidrug efflux system membrane fusion protein